MRALTVVLFMSYSLALLQGQQVTPQTEEEMLRAEYQAVYQALGVDYVESEPIKMGYSLDFSPLDAPAPLRVVSSDGPTQPTLKVRLAAWSATLPGTPRFSVSLSPGLNIGRGVWSWRATACNVTDNPQSLDQGDIESAANSAGIPTIGFGEAQNSNQLFIHRSKPVIGIQIVGGLSGIGTLLIASRVVAASGVWGAAFGGATYAASQLVNYFKSVSPADLAARFSGTTILADGYSAALQPRGSQGHCSSWEFFARTSKNAVTRSGIPVY